MAAPADRREERRKNLTAVGIAAVVVVLALLAVFRPAAYPFVPVGAEALAASIDGKADAVTPVRRGECRTLRAGRFTCEVLIPQGSTGTTVDYEVETSWTGCWEATPSSQQSNSPNLDGCIWIFNL